MIRLVINDDKSQKFWQISKVSSKKVIETNWGKIGGKPRVKEEPYTSEEQADKLIEKMIKQKMAKGYTPDGNRSASPKAVVPKAQSPKAPSPKAPSPKAPSPKAVAPKVLSPKQPAPKAANAPQKTQKRKRCPNGMRKDENGDCVPKTGTVKAPKAATPKAPTPKAPTPKAPTPKAPTPKAPTPEKKTQKRKRCPKGMRKNENGDCVPNTKATAKKTNTKNSNLRPVNKPAPINKPAPVNKPASPEKVTNDTAAREVVYDVVKNGVMLAHTYKDPKTGKLKNPPKGFPAAPKGWYASEKYDGYRAIWDGKDFRSRTGKIFTAPEWFKAWLPSGVALDGELFMGRECFEKCGIFRRKVPDDKEWRKANVTYQIFDVPSMKAPFEKRLEEINKIVKGLCAKKPSGSGECPLRITKQVKVQTEEEVFKMFDSLVEKGAEGVMLRCPGSPYDPKRSAHLLKVKPFFDAECNIIGYKPGTGKYSGKLGAFQCETVKEPKTKFYISGMTDEVRDNYKKTHPVGTVVTYTYVGVNESGVPRHPNYLRKRQSE